MRNDLKFCVSCTRWLFKNVLYLRVWHDIFLKFSFLFLRFVHMTLILKFYLNPSLLVLFHSCLGIVIVILLKESFIIYEATFNLPVETLTTTDVVTSKEEPGLFIHISKKYLKVNVQSSEEAFLSDSSSNSEYDFSYDITLLLDGHPQLSERG